MQLEMKEARTVAPVPDLEDVHSLQEVSNATTPQKQGGPRLKPVPYVEFPEQNDSAPFDWHKDADAVVVEHSPGIAVYLNRNGDVVVRQHDYPDDAVIVICPKDVRRVAKAIIATGAP
jgi:hypothetical protein